MTIACLSDLHGHLPETPPCDLLLLAGDLCPPFRVDEQAQWLDGPFRAWLETRQAGAIVATWGNHDFVGQTDQVPALPWALLVDAYETIDGVSIYGSPWTVEIPGWAFMRPLPELRRVWAKWKSPVDILLTHGPAFNVCDRTHDGRHAGDPHLAAAVSRRRPRLHVHGHIHEAHGRYETPHTLTINAAHCNIICQPKHPAEMVVWV